MQFRGEAVAFLKPFLFSVDSLRQPYVGRSAQSMSAGRPESLLSNWVSDALLATCERLGYQPDFAVCNVGGLRASMPKDTVRRGDTLCVSARNFLRHGILFSVIADCNDIENPNLIYPNQVLQIPVE